MILWKKIRGGLLPHMFTQVTNIKFNIFKYHFQITFDPYFGFTQRQM